MTRPPHSSVLPGADAGVFRYVLVEKHILAMIEAGELRPGDRVPSLRALGTRLGLSVSTVNQAYLELERRGLMEARPRSGFFVRTRPSRSPAPRAVVGAAHPPTAVNRGALIREVLDGMGRRDIVPLGVAQTDEAFLPTKTLARLLAKVAADGHIEVTAYEGVLGNLTLRRQIAWRLAEAGIDVAPGDVMVTAGAMEALYIALRSVTRPGDSVAIAAPSYYCFLQLLENLGLRAVELPSYPEGGVRPADLQAALDRFEVRAVILTPNFNNPDGARIPDAAKAEMAALLAARGVPVIEDDVYGDLHFDDRRPRCLKAYDTAGGVLHCSSFSKTLAPGFRVGYLLPGRFAAKAFEIKATTSVCCATPTQMTVGLYLSQGGFDRHLRKVRATLERQARIMEGEILRHFPPGTRVTHPSGGTVLWVQLPEAVDAIALFYEAKLKGIGVAPGNIFSSSDQFSHFLRLSYGNAWTPAVEAAVATLGRLVSDMQEATTRDQRPVEVGFLCKGC
jgi:DNA-binding transcriptional MocR family regulator